MTDDERKILASFTEKDRRDAQEMNAQASPIAHYVLNDDRVCVTVGLGTWAIWFERFPAKRRVAQDIWMHTRLNRQIEVNVSTVFLGLDHSFVFRAPGRKITLGDEIMERRLFETMTFWGRVWLRPPDLPKRRGRRDHYQTRYPTYETALAGHKHVVERTKLYLAHQITYEQYTYE